MSCKIGYLAINSECYKEIAENLPCLEIDKAPQVGQVELIT